MTGDARIDAIEIVDLGLWAGPGDSRLFVAVHSEGQAGWYGPIADAPGRYVDRLLSYAAVGGPVTDHPALYEHLRAAIGRCAGSVASWAIGAIDCAVWDLHGRLVGAPVASLLADSPTAAVSAYASWLRLDLTDRVAADVVARVAREGWLFTKWGLRRGRSTALTAEVESLAAITQRAAEAAGGRVAFDAMGTWDPALSRAFAGRVDPDSVLWIEDPLPGTDLHAYRAVAPGGLPLAFGERLGIGNDLNMLRSSVGPAALTIDVVGCGGLTRAVNIVTTAEAVGVPVFPHGRSLIPSVHLAAAFPRTVTAVEYQLQWEPFRQLLYAQPSPPTPGRLRLPTVPGLGITPRSP